jgi:hypothetical protein
MGHLTQEELNDLKLGDIVEIKVRSKWIPAIVVPSHYDKFIQFFTIHKTSSRKAPELLSLKYHDYWWNVHSYSIGCMRPDWVRPCSRNFKKDYRAPG